MSRAMGVSEVHWRRSFESLRGSYSQKYPRDECVRNLQKIPMKGRVNSVLTFPEGLNTRLGKVIRKNLPSTHSSPHPSFSGNSQEAKHFSCQVVEDAKREEAKLPSLFHHAGFGLKWGKRYWPLWVKRTFDKNLEF